jgi:hypothetical protein
MPWVPEDWVELRGSRWGYATLIGRIDRARLSDDQLTRVRRRAAVMAGAARDLDTVYRAWSLLDEAEDDDLPYHESWPLTDAERAHVISLALPVAVEADGGRAWGVFDELNAVERSLAGVEGIEDADAPLSRPAVRDAIDGMRLTLFHALETGGVPSGMLATSLLAMGDPHPEVTAALVGALDEHPGLASGALTALALRDGATRRRLLEVMREPGHPGRSSIASDARRIIVSTMDPAWVWTLVDALHDADEDVVHGAIYSLAAVSPLERLLTERSVRFIAEAGANAPVRAWAIGRRLRWGAHQDLIAGLIESDQKPLRDAGLTLLFYAINDSDDGLARLAYESAFERLVAGDRPFRTVVQETDPWTELGEMASRRGWNTTPERDQ